MAQTLTKNRAQFRPYSVTRDYKLFGKEKGTTKSEVIASEATFVQPDDRVIGVVIGQVATAYVVTLGSH
jgi:hypothetical protein